MRVLVTGASGFLGKNLLPRLLAAGHNVTAVIRNPSQSTPGTLSVVSDLSEPSTRLRDAIHSTDAIIHLANDTTPRSSARSMLRESQGGVLPTVNLLELLRSGPGRPLLIFASSGGTVYGRPRQTPIDESHPTCPSSHYGVGKLACEHMIRLTAETHGFRHYILRISNPYGPHQHAKRQQGVIGVWIQACLSGKSLEIWGDGSIVKDYIHVRDVVEAMIVLIESPPIEGIYNLGSGSGASLLEVADLIRAGLSRNIPIIFQPSANYDVELNILNVEKLRTAICWQARTSLESGIAETIRWAVHNDGQNQVNGIL